MHVGEMFVTGVVVIEDSHLLRFALEAHALVAPCAGNTITAIRPHNWDFAFLVRTHPDVVLLHVFLEGLIASMFGLFAG